MKIHETINRKQMTARILRKDVLCIEDCNNLISGAVAGAITDPESAEGIRHADLYYAEIRKFSTDVEKIATNTGFKPDQILMVKNYLFVHIHNLDGEFKQFDPCFEIAESWRRLAFDKENIQPHDILLIKHELNEIDLVSRGYSQSQAHDMTNELYNYTLASEKFYKRLKETSHRNDLTQISGAIRRTCGRRTH